MRRELKEILLIFSFLIVGCLIGWGLGIIQINQLQDPEIIAFFAQHGMTVPEPMSIPACVMLCAWLFSGIAAGLILYKKAAEKWLTSRAPKVLLGIMLFPFYTLPGLIGVIPMVIYKGIVLVRSSLSKTNNEPLP